RNCKHSHQINRGYLHRDRCTTDSAGRFAHPHDSATGDGFRNHVPERTRTKSARRYRVCRDDRRKCRRGNAAARGRSRASEVLSWLGKCGLWNGGRRRDLRDRTRSVRLFPGGRHAGRSASHLLERAKTQKVTDTAAEMTKQVRLGHVNNLCTNRWSSSHFVHSFL